MIHLNRHVSQDGLESRINLRERSHVSKNVSYADRCPRTTVSTLMRAAAASKGRVTSLSGNCRSNDNG